MKGILIFLLLLAIGLAAWFYWSGAPVKPTLEHAKDEAQQAVHTAAEKIAEKTAQPVTAPASLSP